MAAPSGRAPPGPMWSTRAPSPVALFRSEDGGETFELVRALWDHPSREQWVPGGGGLAVHTVITDPRDADAVHRRRLGGRGVPYP